MKFSEYEHRRCEVCGENNAKSIETFTDVLKNCDFETYIDVTTVCCDNCGFVYMNPSPCESEWEQYYSRSFPLYSPADSYSVSNRTALLEKIGRGGGIHRNWQQQSRTVS